MIAHISPLSRSIGQTNPPPDGPSQNPRPAFARQSIFHSPNSSSGSFLVGSPEVQDPYQHIDAAAKVILTIAPRRGEFVFPFNGCEARGHRDYRGVHLTLPTGAHGLQKQPLRVLIDIGADVFCTPKLHPGELAATLSLVKKSIHASHPLSGQKR